MVMPLDIITIIVAVPVVFGVMELLLSILLLYPLLMVFFFGSDSAVVPTLVATVTAVMDGILLNVSNKQHKRSVA